MARRLDLPHNFARLITARSYISPDNLCRVFFGRAHSRRFQIQAKSWFEGPYTGDDKPYTSSVNWAWKTLRVERSQQSTRFFSHGFMNSVADTFERRFNSAWPVASWGNVSVVLGISGGIDSTALLVAMAKIRNAWLTGGSPHAVGDSKTEQGTTGKLMAVHYNHRLRGEQADHDEAFVVSLCDSWGIACQVFRHEGVVYSTGIEEQCRNDRYRAFQQTAQVCGARFIVTAHQRNDQIETLLFRLFRGSSVSGLAGIAAFREVEPGLTLARPLLDFSRDEIEGYLASLGQPYRVDISNQDPSFRRNWIRNELLPLIRQRFGLQVDAALARLAESAGEQTRLLHQFLDDWLESNVAMISGNEVRFNTRAWTKQHDVMVRAALVRLWRQLAWPQQAMTAMHWQRAASTILAGHPSRLELPGQISLVCEDHHTITLSRSVDIIG
ncbi:MAG TPA: tRNA lysidine(34) synthetase TilS [Pirellulaceae bacterium]|nr:tRNA lysidine(34) synthetase TilS [Pirellulaceae bacterium]HMO94185.1 tRNA lysidine(34) synthetase TilS [Pirellulaceae bacterium]HMP71194.1 tRNA lysidine(34) synthetase TilS [Pirellulaceae bacterium]